MSEAEHQAADVLLPAAGVAVFSSDDETLASAGAMKQDWRFARVHQHVQKGDVEDAIRYFQSGATAELIIIQTEEINDHFTDRLGELSGYCSEGTSAIVIGPVNDVYLYRRLISMGVSDYLVKPVKADVMIGIVAKTLITKLGVSGSRLIAFTGAKGGVGTSAIAQAYACGISTVLGHKTVLLDAAGGWSSLSVGLGFDPSATLAQIIRAVEAKNEENLQRMLFRATDKLTVLAGGSDAMLATPASGEQYEKLLDQLMAKYPVVLVDLSSADAALKRVVITRANKVVLVTTPTVTALRFARSLLKEMGDVRGGHMDDFALILNQQGLSKSHEVNARDIEEALEFKVSATVPFLPGSFLGNESEIQKIVTDKDMAPILKNALLPMMKQLLSRSNGDEDKSDSGKKSGGSGGFLSKFMK